MALKLDTLSLVSSSRWPNFIPVVGFWALAVTFASTSSGAPASLSWDFDSDAANTIPRDFEIGTLFDGRPAGEWKVLQTDRAKSPPNVLGQLMGKGAEHTYKVVLIQGTEATDLDVRVSILPISGNADMGGGLIWRAADDRNYYLTRANPLEQNIRVYRVVKGIRHLLQNFDQTIVVRQWHTLQVIHRGCRIQVFYEMRRGPSTAATNPFRQEDSDSGQNLMR
jgi:hypothetical protein